MADELCVEVTLPFILYLPEGEYPTSAAGEPLQIVQVPESGPRLPLTLVRLSVETVAGASTHQAHPERHALSRRLLGRLNRLLRWYRTVTGNPAIGELSQWQVSPFRFALDTTEERRPVGSLVFTASGMAGAEPPGAAAMERLRTGLASGGEPPVPELFLLDAEHALQQGRFREAVLFSWATSASEFSSLYRALVRSRLAGDYREGREQLLGLDVGLRTKMTVILNLLTGHSFYQSGQSNGMWEQLATSYRMRNDIIHRGVTAEQPHAEAAFRVARWVVTEVESIAQSGSDAASDAATVEPSIEEECEL